MAKTSDTGSSGYKGSSIKSQTNSSQRWNSFGTKYSSNWGSGSDSEYLPF